MARSKTPGQHRDAWVKDLRALLHEIGEIPAREWSDIQEQSTHARDALLLARNSARACMAGVNSTRGNR